VSARVGPSPAPIPLQLAIEAIAPAARSGNVGGQPEDEPGRPWRVVDLPTDPPALNRPFCWWVSGACVGPLSGGWSGYPAPHPEAGGAICSACKRSRRIAGTGSAARLEVDGRGALPLLLGRSPGAIRRLLDRLPRLGRAPWSGLATDRFAWGGGLAWSLGSEGVWWSPTSDHTMSLRFDTTAQTSCCGHWRPAATDRHPEGASPGRCSWKEIQRAE